MSLLGFIIFSQPVLLNGWSQLFSSQSYHDYWSRLLSSEKSHQNYCTFTYSISVHMVNSTLLSVLIYYHKYNTLYIMKTDENKSKFLILIPNYIHVFLLKQQQKWLCTVTQRLQQCIYSATSVTNNIVKIHVWIYCSSSLRRFDGRFNCKRLGLGKVVSLKIWFHKFFHQQYCILM